MPNKKWISLGELFDRHVKPKHNVVCMGAYTGPHNDPSLLKVALKTTRGKGSSTVVDSQVDGLYHKLIERESNKKLSPNQRKMLAHLRELPQAGVGDPLYYFREMRSLASKGARIKMPKLKIARATKTGFNGKQFDVLIDAGSLPWIHHAENGLFNPGLLTFKKIMDEYARISRKAILVFQNSESRYPTISDVRDFLDYSQIKYTEHKVKNRYEMPLPNVRRRNYRHDYSYDRALVIHFGPKQKKRIGLA